jgi:type II secretory pathway component PulF
MILPRKDKLTLISNLATMMSAGIPILEAVEGLLAESKGVVRKVLVILRDSLYDGHPLSHGLKKMPNTFDPVTINLIRAAEEAGTLETVLKDLTKSIKKEMAFSDKLRAALTYPLFVMCIFAGVLTFILAFVVPRLGRVFSGFSGQLPPATKFLINASEALLAYYPFIIVGSIAVVVLVVSLYRIRRRAVLNALLSLPGLQGLGRQIDLANFMRSMALLLKAGIPLSDALEFSEAVVSKKDIRRVVRKMKEDVTAGHPLSVGLKASRKTVPSMMIRIIETAEASGALEAAMQDLAEYFESQVSRTLKTVASLLEPTMLVVMGMLVGGMMLAVIAPIYNLITQLNAG